MSKVIFIKKDEDLNNIINEEKEDEMIKGVDTMYHHNDITVNNNINYIDENPDINSPERIIKPFIYIGNKQANEHQIYALPLNFSMSRNNFIKDNRNTELYKALDYHLSSLNANNIDIQANELTLYIIKDSIQIFETLFPYTEFFKKYPRELSDSIMNSIFTQMNKTNSTTPVYERDNDRGDTLGFTRNQYLPVNIYLFINYMIIDFVNRFTDVTKYALKYTDKEKELMSIDFDAYSSALSLQINSVIIDQICYIVNDCIDYYIWNNINDPSRIAPVVEQMKKDFYADVMPTFVDRVAKSTLDVLSKSYITNHDVFCGMMGQRYKDAAEKNKIGKEKE